jgi:hypothetical protein
MMKECAVCGDTWRHGFSDAPGYCSAECEWADTGDVCHPYDLASEEYIAAHGVIAEYVEAMREYFRTVATPRIGEAEKRGVPRLAPTRTGG